ncbi:MAG: hypothetical protein IJV06_03350 [Bacteroidaceae bacterium]|nr:hypothetical protein [Bacteroidaceae bacterium]
MKKALLTFALLGAVASTQAKSWKIGPNSVTGMDFVSINAAMSSSNVNPGDTLYLDQYYSDNVKQVVNKKVVIIGTGYDTSLIDEGVVATLTDSLTLWADGIEVKSVKLNNVKFYADECTLDRCYANDIRIGTVPKGMNHIYSCYIIGQVGNQVLASSSITSISGATTNTYVNAQLDIQNCLLFYSSAQNRITNLTKSIINNNTIIVGSSYYQIINVDNSQITNNILYNTSSL